MPRGLNTETESRLLGQFQYPEFSQCTVKGGKIVPRRADSAYSPAGGSIDAWVGARTGADDWARVYSVEAEQEYYAFCDKDGGTLQLYDHVNTATFDALPGSVPAKPVLSYWTLAGGSALDGGILYGDSRIYTLAWTAGDTFVYGLSPTTTITNDVSMLSFSSITGVDPAIGATITNTTKSKTAVMRGSRTFTPPGERYFVSAAEKSDGTLWQSGDTLTWTGGSGTLSADEAPQTGSYMSPVFAAALTPPAGADGQMLLALEESTGYYRMLDSTRARWDTTDTTQDDTFFPYDDATSGRTSPGALLPVWPGPYDSDGLPEETLYALDTVQTVCWHKNCLFVADGNIIRASEPEKPTYFRKNYTLDAGDTVLKMVSRDEVLEVYTPIAVKYIVGNAPNFELRETGITEGPVSRESITKSDVGTFALFDDGLYLIAGNTRRNLTAGVNTPWIVGMAAPSTSVGGALQGIFYLVDSDGSALAYDWEQDEWFERTFSAQPSGFFYSDTRRALIAKISTAYSEIGTTVGNVAWYFRYKKEGDYRKRAMPNFASIDCDGEMLLTLFVEGNSVQVSALDGTEDVPLVVDRGNFWQIKLSGTGTEANTEIRSLVER